MRPRVILLFLLAVLPVWAGGLVGRPAVPFEGVTLEGRRFVLSDYLGEKPLALHFWSSNCPPCRMEASYWAQAQKAYGAELQIIAIDVQDIPTMARDFVNEFAWTFPVVQDGRGDVAAAYRVTMKPTTVFVAKNGTIVGYHLGPYRRAAAFEQDLIRLINWRP